MVRKKDGEQNDVFLVEQGGYLSQLARWVTGLVTSQSGSFGRKEPSLLGLWISDAHQRCAQGGRAARIVMTLLVNFCLDHA